MTDIDISANCELSQNYLTNKRDIHFAITPIRFRGPNGKIASKVFLIKFILYSDRLDVVNLIKNV